MGMGKQCCLLAGANQVAQQGGGGGCPLGGIDIGLDSNRASYRTRAPSHSILTCSTPGLNSLTVQVPR